MRKSKRSIMAGFLAFLLIINVMFIFPTKRAEAVVWAIPAIPSVAEAGVAIATLIAGGVGSVMAENHWGNTKDVARLNREVQSVGSMAFGMWDYAPEDIQNSMIGAIRDARLNGDSSIAIPQNVQDYLSAEMIPNIASGYRSPVPIDGTISATLKRVQGSDYQFIPGIVISGMEVNWLSCYAGDCSMLGARWYPHNGVEIPHVRMVESVVGADGIINATLELPAGDFTQDIPNPDVDVFADQVAKEVNKVFEKSKRQGVNMPWGLLAGLGVSGGGLLYNPGDETWYNPDGQIYEGDFSEVDWGFPDLTVLTDSKGNVVYDVDGVPVLTVPGYVIPGVAEIPTTDVVTGNPVNTANPTIPSKPDNPPSTKNIRWKDLIDAMAGFTRIFPFSIPWDIGRAFDAVFGGLTPDGIPVWEIEFSVLDKTYSFDFKIPDFFEGWFVFVRSAILIIFDIGIVYSIRKWFGGAS